ncbi:SAV_915 family protein [Kitasatospora sp. NPDC002040]|uniref:SAV_915 family protein n=1 Tax=Kitasatospora sp. NPDC002040 TaxID=3154661 RepID=UPI00332D2905
MLQCEYTEDPEPSERLPAGPLFVPVRPGPMGCTARFFRTPLGSRTAVGFSTEQLLVAALGPQQPWIRLAEPALRALAVPTGVTALTVDPQLSAPAVLPGPERENSWRGRGPRHIGALRVAGAAAVAPRLNLLIG